jgi:hypothetical protein
MIESKTISFSANQEGQILSSVFVPNENKAATTTLNDRINDFSPKNNVCLAVDKLTDDTLIQDIQKLAKRDIRVYLLLGEEDNNKEAISKLAGHCLIRLGVSQTGGMLLQDCNTNHSCGWVLTDSKINTNFELNTQQCDSLYRAFCFLFWNKAKSEILTQDNSPEPVKRPPNGNILLNDDYNLPGKLQDKLLQEENSFLIGTDRCWPYGKLWNLADFDNAPSRLLLQIQENESLPSIEVLCEGSDVHLSERTIENLLVTSENSWWLPNKPSLEKVNWALLLSAEQKSRVQEFLEQMWSTADWVFRKNAKLRDLHGNIRFANQPGKTFNVTSQMSIGLESIETEDIDQFLDPVIERICADQIVFGKDRLVHNVNYTVRINPPLLPSEATAHPLDIQWKQQQQKFQEKLNLLIERLKELDKREGKLSEKLKQSLSGFLLGQRQKSSEIREKMETLSDMDLGRSSPASLDKLTRELNDIIKLIADREARFIKEEDQARKSIEWQDKCQKLDDEISDLDKKVNSIEESHRRNKTKLEEKQVAIDNFPDNVSKSERKKFQKELDDCKRKVSTDSSELQRTKNELASCISRREQMGHEPSSSKNLDNKANSLGTVLGNKIVDDTFRPEWPGEFLPGKGTNLYLHAHRSYLTISDIGQLDTAKKDASRLKAKICVKMEG